MTTQAERMERALEILREYGWCQLRHMDNEGRVCAGSAIRLANGQSVGFGFLSELGPAQRKQIGDDFVAFTETANELFSRQPTGGILSFNDNHSTVFEDIEQVFEKSIVRAQEMGTP